MFSLVRGLMRIDWSSWIFWFSVILPNIIIVCFESHNNFFDVSVKWHTFLIKIWHCSVLQMSLISIFYLIIFISFEIFFSLISLLLLVARSSWNRNLVCDQSNIIHPVQLSALLNIKRVISWKYCSNYNNILEIKSDTQK